MKQLKPETIRSLIIAGILFIILIIAILLTSKNKVTPMQLVKPKKSQFQNTIKILDKSTKNDLYIVSDLAGNNKQIVIFDPSKTDEQIKKELGISDEEFKNIPKVVPEIATGRQLTSQQQLLDQLYEQNARNDLLNNQNYGD